MDFVSLGLRLEVQILVSLLTGCGFYCVKKDGITIVKGGDTVYSVTELKLVPPKTLLYKRIAESYHRKYHFIQSASYIRAAILADNLYMPQIQKYLKKLQDSCPLCRGKTKKAFHNIMGRIQSDRLNVSAPFAKIQSDLIGPLLVKDFANERKNRKIWIRTSICHYSRYISLMPVESLSKASILNTFKAHFLRFGQTQLIETDWGTNFVAARADMITEDTLDKEDVKEITENLKSEGIELTLHVPKTPWITGGVERRNQIVKKVLPLEEAHPVPTPGKPGVCDAHSK